MPTASQEAEEVLALIARADKLIGETLGASPERQAQIQLELAEVAREMKAINQRLKGN